MPSSNTGPADNRPTEAMLVAGAHVGPYEIEGPLGRGGMGDVYRARDTRLGRPVALKFLSDEMTANQAALERFRREGQAICTLNHPNVCTVYDIGEVSGRPYLVMEMLDGQTLRDRIAAGPFSNKELLGIMIPLLEALDAAHGAGIVHRDVKPANIFITKSGAVKILDFGLAKAAGVDALLQDALNDGLTLPNTTVGTLHYMSPEQASGKPLDTRSDLFAAGVVLYEMATGTLPFAADGWGETVAAILNRTPKSARELRPDLMPEIDRVIERAIQKDRTARYQTAAGMRDDLIRAKRIIDSQEFVAAAPVNASPQRKTPLWIALVAAALLTSLGIWWFFVNRKPTATSSSEYKQITDFNDSAAAPALSPDGKMVAFIRGGTLFLNSEQIYVKILPDGQSTRLTNSPNPKYRPVFTPDGSRVAYTTLRPDGIWSTETVPVNGGEPSVFMRNAAGLDWIDPHQVLFSEIMEGTVLHMGIVTSEESRSNERRIYFPPHERAMAHYSYLSPDRKNILIVEMDGAGAWLPCRILPMDGSSSGHVVGPPGACLVASWSPDGKWMYFNVGSRSISIRSLSAVAGSTHLYRQRFPDGQPELLTDSSSEEEGLAVSPDGKSLVSSVGFHKSSVWMHDASGDRPISQEGTASAARITVDGAWIYYLIQDRHSGLNELWRTELSTGKSNPALPGISIRDYDISQDGQHVAFTGITDDRQVFIAPLDGSGPPRLLTKSADMVAFGRPNEIVFRQVARDTNYVDRIGTDGQKQQRAWDYRVAELMGVSPDGNFLVMGGSQEVGKNTFIYSRKDKKTTILCNGPCLMKWTPDLKYAFITTRRDPSSSGLTFMVQTGPDGLPPLPPGGIPMEADNPFGNATVIRQGDVTPSPKPGVYAFVKSEFVGNLFRIPIH